MQKTRNPCKARLECVDNRLIHYFVTLTATKDKANRAAIIARILRCFHSVLIKKICAQGVLFKSIPPSFFEMLNIIEGQFEQKSRYEDIIWCLLI